MQTGKAGQTVTRILVDTVDALRPVPTGVGHTLVDINLTVRAGSACSTTALISIDQIFTRAAMLARRRRALVQLVLA